MGDKRDVGRNDGLNLETSEILKTNLISIYLLTAIGLTPDGSSTVHIYAQTEHRTMKRYTEWSKRKDKDT
jgi:hypothetical protein